MKIGRQLLSYGLRAAVDAGVAVEGIAEDVAEGASQVLLSGWSKFTKAMNWPAG